MKDLPHRRPSPALVISLVALFVSLGGVSYGVATGSINSREIKNNTIKSKDIKNRTIKARDVKRNSLGGSAIRESRLGEVPNAAFATAAGTAGSAGTAANSQRLGGTAADDLVMWAAVLDSGSPSPSPPSIFRSSRPGITVTALSGSEGHYVMTFPRRIDTCAATAQTGSVNGFTPQPGVSISTGQTGVAWRTTNRNQLEVATRDAFGNEVDREFYVVVFC